MKPIQVSKVEDALHFHSSALYCFNYTNMIVRLSIMLEDILIEHVQVFSKRLIVLYELWSPLLYRERKRD